MQPSCISLVLQHLLIAILTSHFPNTKRMGLQLKQLSNSLYSITKIEGECHLEINLCSLTMTLSSGFTVHGEIDREWEKKTLWSWTCSFVLLNEIRMMLMNQSRKNTDTLCCTGILLDKNSWKNGLNSLVYWRLMDTYGRTLFHFYRDDWHYIRYKCFQMWCSLMMFIHIIDCILLVNP